MREVFEPQRLASMALFHAAFPEWIKYRADTQPGESAHRARYPVSLQARCRQQPRACSRQCEPHPCSRLQDWQGLSTAPDSGTQSMMQLKHGEFNALVDERLHTLVAPRTIEQLRPQDFHDALVRHDDAIMKDIEVRFVGKGKRFANKAAAATWRRDFKRQALAHLHQKQQEHEFRASRVATEGSCALVCTCCSTPGQEPHCMRCAGGQDRGSRSESPATAARRTLTSCPTSPPQTRMPPPPAAASAFASGSLAGRHRRARSVDSSHADHGSAAVRWRSFDEAHVTFQVSASPTARSDAGADEAAPSAIPVSTDAHVSRAASDSEHAPLDTVQVPAGLRVRTAPPPAHAGPASTDFGSAEHTPPSRFNSEGLQSQKLYARQPSARATTPPQSMPGSNAGAILAYANAGGRLTFCERVVAHVPMSHYH